MIEKQTRELPGNDHVSHQTGKGKSSTQKYRLGGAMLVPRMVMFRSHSRFEINLDERS